MSNASTDDRAPGRGQGDSGRADRRALRHPAHATGELLRDHVARRTALGWAVQGYLDRGELVPDQVVLDMVREAMVAARAAGGGYVLRASTATATTDDRRQVLRLLVKDVLIGPEKITIRHPIPVRQPAGSGG